MSLITLVYLNYLTVNVDDKSITEKDFKSIGIQTAPNDIVVSSDSIQPKELAQTSEIHLALLEGNTVEIKTEKLEAQTADILSALEPTGENSALPDSNSSSIGVVESSNIENKAILSSINNETSKPIEELINIEATTTDKLLF